MLHKKDTFTIIAMNFVQEQLKTDAHLNGLSEQKRNVFYVSKAQ